MTTASVVEDLDVVRDRESCSGAGGEHLLVIHLVLQAREERFSGGVVPAHPSAVHRLAKPMRLAVAGERSSTVLGSVAGVEDLPGQGAAVDARHLEGVADEAGAHMPGDLPVDHHACGQIDHGGEVEPSFTGAQVGDVTDQRCPGGVVLGGEVACDEAVEDLRFHVGDRGATVAARLDGCQPEFPHQMGHQPYRTGLAFLVELGTEPSTLT
ncbi:Protein of uncharacterised function (DUF2699) [Corynebacterium striatum]|nr:Protein of uncharacterised function (DUF2699) [Corynebacterium striatum]